MIESGDSNMTVEFIDNALYALGGEVQNRWTTLFGKAQRIGLLADNNISIDPRYRAFYFDSDSEMLYITYYDGNLIRYNDGDEIPEGYIIMSIHDNKYLNKISPNAISCELDGSTYKVHAMISYDKIVAFYNPNVKVESYLEELKIY